MQDKTPAPEQDLEYSAETSSGMGEESMGDAEGEGLSWGVVTPLHPTDTALPLMVRLLSGPSRAHHSGSSV